MGVGGGVILIFLPVLSISTESISFHAWKKGCRPSYLRTISARSTGNNNSGIYRYGSVERHNPRSTATTQYLVGILVPPHNEEVVGKLISVFI